MITAPYASTAARDVAAPNGSATSNSPSNAITNAAGGAMGKDQFVKLLITQMKNQDPMNPMDGKDLAAQLAQFSSVEQLININAKLDAFASLLPTTPSTTGSTPTTPTA